MKVRKAIKKILALGTGVFMMGGAMTGALAVDLSTYPAPFVMDGVFDGYMVIGDNAATEDVLGVTYLASSLQAVSFKEESVEGTTTVDVEGDSKKIEESSNKLEMGELMSGIISSVTSSDLTALADGSISNEHGTFTYTQTIDIPEGGYIEFAIDPDDTTDTPKDYLYINQSQAYVYKISFTPAVRSDHRTSTGTDYLDDLRDKKLTLMGKEYTILKADHTSRYQSLELTFMGGAVGDILEEGETKTYTLEGTDYEVTLDYVSTSEAKFTVNGEVTDSMAETETYKLTDGVEIGVTDIMENEAGEAAGGDKVQLSLGADKIKLADTNTNTSGNYTTTSDCTVTIGTSDLSSVLCNIVTSADAGVSNGNDVDISSLEIWYTPSSDLYIGEGEKASVKAADAESETGIFFLDGFDYEYKGLTMPNAETIEIQSAGSKNYKLKFTNKAGVEYDVYMWSTTGAASGEEVTLSKRSGSTTRDVVIDEAEEISDEEFFIVNKNKYTRIFQFKSVKPGSSTSDNAGTITVKDLGTGQNHELSYASLTGNLNIDGNTFQFNLSGDSTSANINGIDLDGDGSASSSSYNNNNGSGGIIYTQSEAYLNLSINVSGTSADGHINESHFYIRTPEDEDNNRDTVYVNLTTNSEQEIDVQGVKNTKTGGLNQVGDTDVYEDYTYGVGSSTTDTSTAQYGMKVAWDKKTSAAATAQDDITITVGKSGTYGNVFVTSGVTTTATTGGGTTTQVIQEIDLGSYKLASEVADASAQNLILIGGPCANSVARSVMGVTLANCAEGFSAGKAKIKLYEQATGNVALVVAGYDGIDTRRAALVLGNYGEYTAELTGAEVEVTTVTASPIVAQPTVEEPEADADADADADAE